MKGIWGKKQKRIPRLCIGAIAAVWAAFFIHINLAIPPPADKFIPRGKRRVCCDLGRIMV